MKLPVIQPQPEPDRRAFLRRAGRWCALAALGGGGAWLALRRSAATDESCINNSLCGRCGQLPRCGLPQAGAYRKKQGHETT